jgi:tetratricopeptide (TPR) repeat protein
MYRESLRITFSLTFILVCATLFTPIPARADFWSATTYGLNLLTGARPFNVAQSNPAREQAIKSYNKGVGLLRHGRADEAVQFLEEARQIDPSLEFTYGALGAALFQCNNYPEAIGFLERAIQIDGKHAGNWFELALCAEHLQRYEEELHAFQHFLSIEPNGEGAEHARSVIAILQHTYMSTSQTIAHDRETNYLTSEPGRMLARWSAGQMPLRVYISTDTTVPGYRPEFALILRDAFKAWTACTSGLITFDFVDDPHAADVLCSWTSNESDLHIAGSPGKELGVTATDVFSDGSIRHAEIRLLSHFGDDIFTDRDMWARARSVDLHEIGHALGLQHSPEPYDTMAPRVAPVGLEFPLTMRDRNTVLALYTMSMSGSMPENEPTSVYGVKSTPTNLAVAMSSPATSDESFQQRCEALIQEASMANRQGNFSAAIETLEKAHRMQPSNPTISHHLGLAYSNAATASGGSDTMVTKSYYEKAIRLLAEAHDNESFESVLSDYNQFITGQTAK